MTTLHTERLILRPVEPGDGASFEAFYSNPQVMAIRKYGVLDSRAARKQVATMLDHWQKHDFGMWVVEEKAGGEFAGECGLRWLEDASDIELSYGILPRFRARGLATEAARAALGFAVDDLGLERIVALSRGDNVKSHRVLQKLGMQLEWRKNEGAHGLVRYLFVADGNAPTASRE